MPRVRTPHLAAAKVPRALPVVDRLLQLPALVLDQDAKVVREQLGCLKGAWDPPRRAALFPGRGSLAQVALSRFLQMSPMLQALVRRNRALALNSWYRGLIFVRPPVGTTLADPRLGPLPFGDAHARCPPRPAGFVSARISRRSPGARIICAFNSGALDLFNAPDQAPGRHITRSPAGAALPCCSQTAFPTPSKDGGRNSRQQFARWGRNSHPPVRRKQKADVGTA
ncbi:hypothetical protein ACVIW0_001488 [Bradyrhizobium sp. USDA 4454]